MYKCLYFLVLHLITDCGYSLEPPNLVLFYSCFLTLNRLWIFGRTVYPVYNFICLFYSFLYLYLFIIPENMKTLFFSIFRLKLSLQPKTYVYCIGITMACTRTNCERAVLPEETSISRNKTPREYICCFQLPAVVCGFQ